MAAATAECLGPAKPVLIVDDYDDVREVLCEMLAVEGYTCVTATDGADALAQLRSGVLPCLILLDYHMPVMDGVTFRKQQIADPALAGIPVVLYSGAYDVRLQAQALGLPHVCQKPLDFSRLVDLVKRYC